MELNQQAVSALWWSIYWRWTVVGTLAGLAAGATVGLFAPSAKAGMWLGFVAGIIVGIPVSRFAVRRALTKHLPSLVVSADGAQR
jgi:hypothetical protein